MSDARSSKELGEEILNDAVSRVASEASDLAAEAAIEAAGYKAAGPLWPIAKAILWAPIKLAAKAPADRRMEAFRRAFDEVLAERRQQASLVDAMLGALSETHWQLLRNQSGMGATLGSVEDQAREINERTLRLLEQLAETQQQVRAFALGEGARIELLPLVTGLDTVWLCPRNSSVAPAFDLVMEAIDLDGPTRDLDQLQAEFERGPPIGRSRLWSDTKVFATKHLYPGRMIDRAMMLDIEGRDTIRMNVFIKHRSGQTIEQIRICRDNQSQRPIVARAVNINGEGNEYSIPPTFPGYDPDGPEALFSEQPTHAQTTQRGTE